MKARSTHALVDLAALRSNYRELRRLAGGLPVCAVVKADAYGHGALRVASALGEEGAEYFAVALLEEALELREAGTTAHILVLGISDVENADLIVKEEISQTVYTAELARALSGAAVRQGRTAHVHLKIDTGMHRQGVDWEEAGGFAGFLADLPGLELEGVYSHFAESESEDSAFTDLQEERFRRAVSAMRVAGAPPRIAHIANSAAIQRRRGMDFGMVRSGILLYGLSPDGSPGIPKGFKPVMSLRTTVVDLQTRPAGESLSYGRTYRLSRDSIVGLLPIGYADGYPRVLSNRAQILVRGRKAPVVGRICMDQTLVDLTEVPDARVGDEVILFGDEALPAGELSALAGTIDYEITCGVSRRVPRLYKE